MQYTQIDRKSPEIMAALAIAQIYTKFGEVTARPATAGETVVTTLAGGTEETTNTANDGDWIVTNPSGERYIVPAKRFLSSYEPTDRDGTYKAKGSCRAIQNPFGKPIEIMASWGSPQFGDEHCLIVDTCDAHGNNMGGEPYLIDGAEFVKTYK